MLGLKLNHVSKRGHWPQGGASGMQGLENWTPLAGWAPHLLGERPTLQTEYIISRQNISATVSGFGGKSSHTAVFLINKIFNENLVYFL